MSLRRIQSIFLFFCFCWRGAILSGSEIDSQAFRSLPTAEKISIIKELLAEDKDTAAIEAIEIFLIDNPRAERARTMLAALLIQEKQYTEAERQIDYLLSIKPNLAAALNLQATLYLSTDRDEEALAIYQYLAQSEPSFPNSIRLVNVNIRLKKYEEAKALLSELTPQTEKEQEQKQKYEEYLKASKHKEIIERAVEFIEIRAYECARYLLIDYLNQNPCDEVVQILLARVYGYEGYFDLGIDLISCVLANDICSPEAWKVLAEIYRGMGLFAKSLWIYTNILADECDENTRIGLAYSFLAISNRSGACEIAYNLKNEALCEDIQRDSFFDQTYRYLHDSQDLSINQYVVRLAWWRGNCFSDLVYDHMEERSPDTGGYLDRFQGSIYLPINNIWDTSLKFGVAHVNGHTYPIGEAFALIRLPWGFISGSTGYQIYDGTAESLDNRIRYSTSLVNYSHTLNDRNKVGALYAYTIYSDGNHTNQINLNYDYLLIKRVFSYCYKLPFNPQINIRYDITYINAARFAPLGYFSGRDFLENRVSLAIISLTTKDLERRFELIPSVSYLTYEAESDTRFRGWFYGGVFNGYFDLTKSFLFVAGAKAGKYNFVRQTDYWYYELAARLVYEF